MIDVLSSKADLRRAYDLFSRFYGCCVAPLERKARLRGVDLLAISRGERVLEVAVGPGATLPEIERRAGAVWGVDLSPKMLEKARARCPGADLRLADARSLPFPAGTFDALYNSYMLDLIPSAEIPAVLAEFRRVLRPGGRIALVNLSKETDDPTWLERIYAVLPGRGAAFLFGGCRPVRVADLMTGFEIVRREFIPFPFPSEIIVARKL